MPFLEPVFLLLVCIYHLPFTYVTTREMKVEFALIFLCICYSDSFPSPSSKVEHPFIFTQFKIVPDFLFDFFFYPTIKKCVVYFSNIWIFCKELSITDFWLSSENIFYIISILFNVSRLLVSYRSRLILPSGRRVLVTRCVGRSVTVCQLCRVAFSCCSHLLDHYWFSFSLLHWLLRQKRWILPGSL